MHHRVVAARVVFSDLAAAPPVLERDVFCSFLAIGPADLHNLEGIAASNRRGYLQLLDETHFQLETWPSMLCVLLCRSYSGVFGRMELHHSHLSWRS